MLDVDPPRSWLFTLAFGRWAPPRVMLLRTSQGDATVVTVGEEARDPLSRLAINLLTDSLVHHRAVESLRRWKRVAETGVVRS